jgi:ParB family chromosome partitioning protein
MASRTRSGKSTGRRPRTAARGRLAPRAEVRGLAAADVIIAPDSAELTALGAAVREAGGVPIGGYHEPLGGRPLMLACLPIAAVQPTPFQRDLSPTHTQRLAAKIDEAAVFLDPLIVVRGQEGGFWTPNGRHRLAAAKLLGLRQITALISPDETLAYRILALNTEKAHNLRDRSLEAIRMARSLGRRHREAREVDYAAQLESAELLTLGIAYEHAPRFAGGAYGAFLKKVDRFSERTLAASLREREGFAARLRDIDARVTKLIGALQSRGFKSPYLRNYIVARINPVRFHKAASRSRAKGGSTKLPPPPMPLSQALTRMTAAARAFRLESVSNTDLAWVAAGAEAQSE